MFFVTEGVCPKCGQKGQEVSHEVLMAHLKDISKIVKDKKYFFCWSPECENIYFAVGENLSQQDVIREVGYKDYSSSEGVICFCFDYKKGDIGPDSFKEKKMKVKIYGCNCALRNPSGGCCTSWFRDYVKKRFGQS